ARTVIDRCRARRVSRALAGHREPPSLRRDRVPARPPRARPPARRPRGRPAVPPRDPRRARRGPGDGGRRSEPTM
ncbi:MAG: hypothetical protein AVDCRST_MAG67-4251, partial [uncultured Solirubrobacteraceae bacterium]